MAIEAEGEELLLLPPDVIVAPVGDFDRELRARMNAESSDFVISRSRLRGHSLLIDQDAAGLLQCFRSPASIAHAVAVYSTQEGRDAVQVLRNAWPLLVHLKRLRLLNEVGSEIATAIEPSLEDGSLVGDYEIRRCVHVLEDVEVYEAVGVAGRAAVKIARNGAPRQTINGITNEAAMLRYLRGRDVPLLLAESEHVGRRYLAMEWSAGVRSGFAATALRGSAKHVTAEAARLCLTVLRAYEGLHERGVVHGDIHPGNVLVGCDERVTLVDFALARFTCEPTITPLPRRGIGYFLEPEFAVAKLSGEPDPAPTALGEQYGLAALCFFLLSGAHYLGFPLERDAWLNHIAGAPAVEFMSVGVACPRAIEQTLHRALRKEPEKRFPNVAEFAAQLEAAIDEAFPAPTVYALRFGSERSASNLARVLSEVGFAKNRERHPRCSINFGAGGVAYFLLQLARLRESAQLLALADLWSTWAIAEREDPEAFACEPLGIRRDEIGGVSLYHSSTGLFCVQAQVEHAIGNQRRVDAAIRAFITACAFPCANQDLTLGRSGILLACAMLTKITTEGSAAQRALHELGNETYASLWNDGLSSGAVPDSARPPFLGTAHGWAGMLYAGLLWSCVAGRAPDVLGATLTMLEESAQWTSEGAIWPAQRNAKPDARRWSGWCHGTAGYVHLWLVAHRAFGDQRYRSLAVAAASATWENSRRAPHGTATLCCGYGGEAYALLAMFRETKDPLWLARAQVIADKAGHCRAHGEALTLSLYRGDLGIALLLEEIAQPEMARMPMFEC
ncbi:MAG TPA: lanthionine synthetase LanC family protein [Candidatus Cybelea sp.]